MVMLSTSGFFSNQSTRCGFTLAPNPSCSLSAPDQPRFSDSHNFTKPNDERALLLMDRAAQSVIEQMPDVIMAFGESDEYR
jgi:tRNA(His) guanylyltransferase